MKAKPRRGHRLVNFAVIVKKSMPRRFGRNGVAIAQYRLIFDYFVVILHQNGLDGQYIHGIIIFTSRAFPFAS